MTLSSHKLERGRESGRQGALEAVTWSWARPLRRVVAAALVAATASAVGGCASFDLPADWTTTGDLGRARVDVFPGRHRAAPRLPEPTSRAALAGDDAVGFGLELRDGDEVERWILTVAVDELRLYDDNGEVRRRTLLLPTAQDEDGQRGVILFSDVARLIVRGHDAYGEPGETTFPEVPVADLEFGFAAACAELAGREVDEFESGAVRTVNEAVTALLGLFRVVRDDPMLADILWKVVRLPSVWGILARLDLDIAIEPRFQDAAPATIEQLADLPPAWLDQPVWRLPVRIDVNDEPVLVVQMLVQEPRAPLTLTAGCLALIATHPTDPGLRFSMQVLDGGLAPSTVRQRR